MSYFKEVFFHRDGDATSPIVEALCLIADELRLSREWDQQRARDLDEEVARNDELEQEREVARENRARAAEQMMKLGQSFLSVLPQMAPPGVVVPPIIYASPVAKLSTLCKCGHPDNYHGEGTPCCIGAKHQDGPMTPCDCVAYEPATK